MKDSHGQTVQPEDMSNEELDAELRSHGLDPEELDREMLERLEAKASDYEGRGETPPPQFTEMLRQFRAPEDFRVNIVQDYREYTAEEILHGIVKFTEQAGWGDPANLGHWLGAAQRWAKERV